ncbi:hypothetical protein RDI58_006895 [Solanum bulbocastanum]|uniref:Uncharacterized protein n=1 Tax=Solanum bulbocastanum TaxID=147425 RepID=A0AAN8TY86_SOLBU
MLKFFFFSL